MRKPLSAYSGDERRQIAALAKRNLKAEVRLILGGGFALVMIAMSFVAEQTFLPLSFALGLRPTVVWVGLSFGCAVVWAWWHHSQAKPRIMAAQVLDAAFLHDYQAQRRREHRKK
ncbi:hypothetical protein [Yoonia litorea]|uniref:Uncharacterized protein n=1 Tax=Yoonia litorea TaxID=1123755 RepID=A0A1I6MKJ4_9RHOB|nr:hypothetical protein [Yoonia litorea]SFS16246.1 hypothetical protein SAMN05444714_1974 [Yoonia litorea]